LDNSFRRSRYLQIKEGLESVNIEYNRDKDVVKNEIDKFDFPKELNECLDRFDDNYRRATDEFDFKETIGHIRSFIELLTTKIAYEVEGNSNVHPSQDLKKFGGCRDYLKQKDVGFLNKVQDNLLGSVWSFVSDTGVHPIKSQKEYARLAKNFSIELALFLFERLHRYSEDY